MDADVIVGGAGTSLGGCTFSGRTAGRAMGVAVA